MILISPAKRLVDRENSSNLKSSEPIFQSEANKLAEHMATLSSKELQSLMGVSEDIAKLNQHRYNNWNNTNNLENRAIFQFEGDVYKNLDASSLSNEEQDYLNKIPSFVTITKKVEGNQSVGQVMKDSIEDFRRDLQEQKESLLNREYNNDD